MYEQKTIAEVKSEFQANLEGGLTDEEAKKRRQEYGENVFEQEKPKSALAMFAEQLNEPLIYVLIVAAAVSILLKEYEDALIILGVITLNAIVGVIQEGKAQKALAALKDLTSPTALVKRNGVHREIPASDLVPGDMVCLEAGRQIPADLRLVSSMGLKVEESTLTGESVPVDKDASFTARKKLPLGDCANMLFMTTSVALGRGEGVVTATGMNTEIGKIAGMINNADTEPTPLQKRLADLGKILSLIALIICAALFGIALIQKRNVFEMLLVAISLAVAAVPEGLPAVVTIVLALSVSKMVKVNTIIRKLPSVETLGAVSIVCSDKTGTLTQNKMKVVECFANLKNFPVKDLDKNVHITFIEGFVLCNDGMIEKGTRLGDPTELALIDMAESCKVHKEELDHKKRRIGELPFDSKRKMMTTLHRTPNGTVSYTKGAGDVILNRCSQILMDNQIIPINAYHKKEIKKIMERMSGKALRVLSLAMRVNVDTAVENGLVFVGLVGMIDPPRPEAANAIKIFKDASVKTVMITGDHIETAFAIAKELKIADKISQCISGEELNHMSDQQLADKVGETTVFARVSPEHKVRIVKAFKTQGHIVAMTGDGVNDAPSLKTADIGIAMGMNGTDVAKNAADLVLTDDNFATIEKAIEVGRGIYENIKKSIIFLLSSNFGEIITMFAAILAGLVSPLKSSHILWVNLITDSLPALALGVDKNDTKQLMQKPPRNPKENLLAHGGMFYTLFYGALIAGITLIAFLYIPYIYLTTQHIELTIPNIRVVLEDPGILARSQTYAFTVLGLSELFHAIGMRNTERSFLATNPLSNPTMIAAFFMGILLQVAVTEIPYLIDLFGTVRLKSDEWIILLLMSGIPLVAHELLLLSPIRLLKKLHKGQNN